MRFLIEAAALQDEATPESSYAALSALLARMEGHEILILLDGGRPRLLEGSLRAALHGKLARHDIIFRQAPPHDGTEAGRPDWRTRVAADIRAAAIANAAPDAVLVAVTGPEGVGDADTIDRLGPGVPQIFLDFGSGSTSEGPHVEAAGAARPAFLLVQEACGARLGSLVAQHHAARKARQPSADGRPVLVYVSPLPPERSGISAYSRELLAALSRHYEIKLVVLEPEKVASDIRAAFAVHGLEWFERQGRLFERILYQFGNSNFHRHMFELLARIPGLVTLHEVFLSGVISDMDTSGFRPGLWARELYHAHGYGAVRDRHTEKDAVEVIWRYPCSRGVIDHARGVVVHSQAARRTIGQWYGRRISPEVSVVPHLRAPTGRAGRDAARAALGLAPDDFLVCNFGGIGPTKLNHRLLAAWRGSRLAQDRACRLVFVGPNGGHYGQCLEEAIGAGDGSESITGWVGDEEYRAYLEAADLAVQLRGLSRGETSGTVLDCMAAGVPVITNAHGAMVELAADAVLLLDDGFSDRHLSEALERLHADEALRCGLARRASASLLEQHAPVRVAEAYRDAIEASISGPRAAVGRLVPALADAVPASAAPGTVEAVASFAALSLPSPTRQPRLYYDVTAIASHDLQTGVQRAVKEFLAHFIAHPPGGFRIEPIYAADGTFRFARRFTTQFMNVPPLDLQDEPVDFSSGDAYFMADLHHEAVIQRRWLYREMRRRGVEISFMLHDLLPVRLPHCFPSFAHGTHGRWLEVVAEADKVISVSRAVAEDFRCWIEEQGGRSGEPEIWYSHHGGNLSPNSAPTVSAGKTTPPAELPGAGPIFLMVGTVEPRKGHAQVLDAFELLWRAGEEARLVIVGRAGWMVDPLIRRLRRHRQLGRRLFWFAQADDALLERQYEAADYLVAASLGEGFGLPLVEAGAKGLRVVARDLPVFREVAPPDTRFFEGGKAEPLAECLRDALRAGPEARGLSHAPLLTWAQSAGNLVRILAGEPIETSRHCGRLIGRRRPG